MAAKAKAMKMECECKPVLGILGIILIALGIYALVWGFITQTNSQARIDLYAILLYILGIFLFGFGKMYKHKGYGHCKMHCC